LSTGDDRGAIFTEFLIALLPVLALAFAIFQVAELYTVKMAVDHAAANSARAAVVVFPDDPKYYGGEAVNEPGPQRTAAVRLAALRSLSPFVLDGSVRSVAVEFPNGVPKDGNGALTVEIHATFKCRTVLVDGLVCSPSNGTRDLVARSTLPNHSARFDYE
jgi:hypothetical protein